MISQKAMTQELLELKHALTKVKINAEKFQVASKKSTSSITELSQSLSELCTHKLTQKSE